MKPLKSAVFALTFLCASNTQAQEELSAKDVVKLLDRPDVKNSPVINCGSFENLAPCIDEAYKQALAGNTPVRGVFDNNKFIIVMPNADVAVVEVQEDSNVKPASVPVSPSPSI